MSKHNYSPKYIKCEKCGILVHREYWKRHECSLGPRSTPTTVWIDESIYRGLGNFKTEKLISLIRKLGHSVHKVRIGISDYGIANKVINSDSIVLTEDYGLKQMLGHNAIRVYNYERVEDIVKILKQALKVKPSS